MQHVLCRRQTAEAQNRSPKLKSTGHAGTARRYLPGPTLDHIPLINPASLRPSLPRPAGKPSTAHSLPITSTPHAQLAADPTAGSSTCPLMPTPVSFFGAARFRDNHLHARPASVCTALRQKSSQIHRGSAQAAPNLNHFGLQRSPPTGAPLLNNRRW